MRAEVKTRWKMPVLRDRECENSMDCFLGLELAKIANIQEQVNLAMDGLNSDSTNSTKLAKISEIEESLDSFNAYRLQVNQSLIAIKEKLNELELIIADSPNE